MMTSNRSTTLRTLTSNADRIEHSIQRTAAIGREVVVKRLATACALGVLALLVAVFLHVTHA